MRSTRRLIPILLLAALVVALPLVGSGYVRGLVVLGGASVIAVAGLALLVGHAGQLSLAQGAFVALGAYAYGILTATYHWPPLLAFPFAVVAVGAVAWLVGRALLRLNGHFFALGTLSFASIVLVLLHEAGPLTGGPSGLAGIPPLLPALPALVPRDAVAGWLTWALAGLALLAFERLIRSEVGTALSAFRTSEVGTMAIGIDTTQLKSATFVLASTCAAVAGVVQAGYLSFISPAGFDVLLGIQLVVMVLVGGAARCWGPVVGVVAVTAAVEILRGVVPLIVPGVRGPVELVGLSLILGLTMVLLPHGLVGGASLVRQRRRADEIPVGVPPGRRDGSGAVLVGAARARLRIDGLSRRFGGVRAVEDVRVTLEPGQVVGLIGPNGAGKTTLVNLVTGVDRPDAGSIHLDERDITRSPSFARARFGIGRTFQDYHLFDRLSVLDHLLLAGRRGAQPSTLRTIVGPGRRSEEEQATRRAEAALDAVGLGELRDRPAAELAPGQQRLLDLARALALDPAVLLLDEPLSGLDAAERETLLDLLRGLRARGLATLWIEHDVPAVMAVADRVVVLDQGCRLAEGTPAEVAADPNVVRAYLGTAAESVRQRRLATIGEPLLTVQHLQVDRGSTRALHDASLRVDRGEIVAVLGPNGAGKSTLLGALAGLFRASGGDVQIDGMAILGEPPERMLRRGVVLVPERRQVFEPLTVHENLMLGSYATHTGRALFTSSSHAGERLASVFALFPVLADRRTQLAGTLSGGEQQMLAIGRALMSRPRLLMLDEPSLGLAPRIVAEIMQALADLRDAGTTILLVEQATHAALGLADRAYLLERGAIVLSGTAESVASDPRVARGYLGSPAAAEREGVAP